MPRGFTAEINRYGCPCGQGNYEDCCGPLHRGEKRALTCEQLMRSRYSAFARSEITYLLQTHQEPELPDKLRRRQLEQNCRRVDWLGLNIISIDQGQEHDLEGTVTFEACYKTSGKKNLHKETSYFQRREMQPEGDWLYIKAQKLA